MNTFSTKLRSIFSRRSKNLEKLGQLQLAGPNGREVIAQATYMAAQDILGIRVEEGRQGAAIIARAPRMKIAGNYWRPGERMSEGRSVVLHQKDFDPRAIFDFDTDSFSMLIRSVQKNFGPHIKMLEAAKVDQNEVYTHYLDLVQEHVKPTKFPVHGRDALVWTKYNSVVPQTFQRTAALDGEIIPYNLIGSVIYSTINRLPMEMLWHRLNPLVHASPQKPWPVWNLKPHAYYVIGYKAYAFWYGVPNYNRIDELLDLDVDIYMYVEKVGKEVYAQVVLRAESEWSEWQTPDFVTLDKELKLLGGSWSRVGSAGVQEAFHFFIPGSPPPPTNLLFQDWKRHVIRKVNVTLPAFTERVSYSDDVGGDVMIGKLGPQHHYRIPQSFFLRGEKRHSWLMVAQSDTGKTTLANYIALEQTPYVLSLQLSPTEVEAAYKFAPNFGGRLYPKNLSDEISGEPEDNARKELDLFRKDIQSAREETPGEIANWIEKGRPNLPSVIYTPLTTVRYYNWLLYYLQENIRIWRDWSKEHGGLCISIFDDLSGLAQLHDNDPYLGDLPGHVRREFRRFFYWFINNCRKYNMGVIATAHSLQEVAEEFPPGTLSSFTTVVNLEVGGKYVVDVVDPKRDATIAPQLNVRLPENLLRIIGR